MRWCYEHQYFLSSGHSPLLRPCADEWDKLLMADSVSGLLVCRLRIMGLWPNSKGINLSPKEVSGRCRTDIL